MFFLKIRKEVATEMNIPHIYAENELDLYRVQGFVMARDRYVQFELGRRFGQGIVSELLGTIGLPIDQQSRGRGMRHIAHRLWSSANEGQRAKIEAFAQGINAFIREVWPICDQGRFRQTYRRLFRLLGHDMGSESSHFR